MPHPLILGLFESLASAAHAARAVHALGITADALSVVARDHEEEGRLARELNATPGVEIEDSRLAARFGELGAYLVAAVAVGVPGLGPAMVAGPLSAELGEAAGHLAGDLSGMLRKLGFDTVAAEKWQALVHDGMILLAVHAAPGNAEAVHGAFEQSGATAIARAQWQ